MFSVLMRSRVPSNINDLMQWENRLRRYKSIIFRNEIKLASQLRIMYILVYWRYTFITTGINVNPLQLIIHWRVFPNKFIFLLVVILQCSSVFIHFHFNYISDTLFQFALVMVYNIHVFGLPAIVILCQNGYGLCYGHKPFQYICL